MVSVPWERSTLKAIEVYLDYLPCEATIGCESLNGTVTIYDLEPVCGVACRVYGSCRPDETPLELRYSACDCS
ncbi:MAG: hypothetical protein WC911_01875 [Thermoleophilia bacterium]